jgi:hypothetical protein
MATQDPKASVRTNAIEALSELETNKFEPIFIKATQDSAYSVVAAAISALADKQGNAALKYAKGYLQTRNKVFQMRLSSVIAQYGTDDYTNYFQQQLQSAGHYAYPMLNNYIVYLKKQDSTMLLNAKPALTKWYQANKKSVFKNVIENLKTPYTEKYNEASNALKSKKLNEADKIKWTAQQQAALSMINHITEITND